MRLIPFLLFIAAVVFLGQALLPLLGGGSYSPQALGQVWSSVEPKSLIAVGKGMEQVGMARVYDAVVAPIIGTAVWIILLVLSLATFALAWVATGRR